MTKRIQNRNMYVYIYRKGTEKRMVDTYLLYVDVNQHRLRCRSNSKAAKPLAFSPVGIHHQSS